MARNGLACRTRKGRMGRSAACADSIGLGWRGPRSILRLTPALFLAFVLLHSGCEPPQGDVTSPVKPLTGEAQRQAVEQTPVIVPTGFAPARINILPLTELIRSSSGDRGTTLNVYIALLDAFGSQMKAPGILRFELYEYVRRSAEPKGQRLPIWPDIDLTGPAENSKYWRDFLRAYEFQLDVRADPEETYVLEATCMRPEGKRLSTEFTLKPSK